MALNLSVEEKAEKKLKPSFTRGDFKNALKACGLKAGAVVFSHSNLSYFGLPEGGTSAENYRHVILEPIMEILGPEGTLVVPAFTYACQRSQVFDAKNSPSVCGMLAEMVRTDERAFRSDDPIFSVAAIGARAREMTENVPTECFGKGSFWERFEKADGVVVNLNLGVPVTYFHYIERMLNLPYRYDKLFINSVCRDGILEDRKTIFYCKDMATNATEHEWLAIDKLAHEKGLARSVAVGKGFVTYARAKDLAGLIKREAKNNKFFLTKARDFKKPPVLDEVKRSIAVKIPKKVSVKKLYSILRATPRDMVCDGSDALLAALAKAFSIEREAIPTGEQYHGWPVPEKWTCYEGSLETLGGKKILSYAQNPACVASYSKSFEGKVSRRELFDHLHTDSQNADKTPSRFIYYDTTWGFCVPEKLKADLKDGFYNVKIKSDLSFGSLKIGTWTIKGKKKDSIVLAGHFSDQIFAEDGIFSTLTGIEAMRELQKRKKLKHTYRLILLPYDFNIAMYLGKNKDILNSVKGGLFLGNKGKGMLPKILSDAEEKGREVLKGFDCVELPLTITDFTKKSLKVRQFILKRIGQWES